MRTRTKVTTTTLANGTKVERRKIVSAPELEWKIQAAAVRRIKSMPGYGDEWADGVEFTLAGDMNAARRGRAEQVKAKATGIASGDPDLRLYFQRGKLGLIEFKAKEGRMSPSQIIRHQLLRGLGYDVVVVKAASEDEGAELAVALVNSWLGRPANDNTQ